MELLKQGDRYELTFGFDPDKVRRFAELSGDTNPLHLDAEYAATRSFGKPIVHGMFVASLFSRVIGMHFPGEGTIYLSQDLEFTAPVFTEDEVTVQIEVLEILEKGRVRLRTSASVTGGSRVIDGEALVIAPRGRT